MMHSKAKVLLCQRRKLSEYVLYFTLMAMVYSLVPGSYLLTNTSE